MYFFKLYVNKYYVTIKKISNESYYPIVAERDILGHHKHKHTQCTDAKTIVSLEIQSYSNTDVIFTWLSHDYSYDRFKCYPGLCKPNAQTKGMVPGI